MPKLASIGTIPCPVGGWNAYNSLDNMPPTDAAVLTNFFPETSNIRLRRGYIEHCDTGESTPVGSLMEWSGGSSSQLLAATNGKIIDVTSSTPSVLATGYGSDIWSTTSFSSAGGQYLLAANDSGADTPFVYNGTIVAAVVVSGVTATDLCQVHLYNQRVFYVERNSLSVWYTTAGAFQGALTEFDFGPFCARGGEIAAVATWTRDNGFGGVDDLFIVVTTKGELLVYIGPNPGSSTTWSMQGRFVLGEPVKGAALRCPHWPGPGAPVCGRIPAALHISGHRPVARSDHELGAEDRQRRVASCPFIQEPGLLAWLSVSRGHSAYNQRPEQRHGICSACGEHHHRRMVQVHGIAGVFLGVAER